MKTKISTVIFDWAGTTVDYGCFAPVAAFVGAFKHLGIEVSDKEARYNRYKENQAILVEGMKEAGYDALLPVEIQSPIITSFIYPTSDFDFKAFYEELKKQGFVLYPGKISQCDTFRIGNIGDVHPKDIKKLVEIIKGEF